jgi:hypothetical protein
MLQQLAAPDVFQGSYDAVTDISKRVPKSHEPKFATTVSTLMIYVKLIYCLCWNKFEYVAIMVRDVVLKDFDH